MQPAGAPKARSAGEVAWHPDSPRIGVPGILPRQRPQGHKNGREARKRAEPRAQPADGGRAGRQNDQSALSGWVAGGTGSYPPEWKGWHFPILLIAIQTPRRPWVSIASAAYTEHVSARSGMPAA